MDKLDLFSSPLPSPLSRKKNSGGRSKKTLAGIHRLRTSQGRLPRRNSISPSFLQPHGHPVEGIKESLPHLKRDALSVLSNACYHPNNAILTVVGDMTADESVPPSPPYWKMAIKQVPKEDFKATSCNRPRPIKIDRNITQANLRLMPESAGGNPDYYTANVMNYILGGGGFASRLTEEIRNKRGLAYSVASFFDPGKYPGSFQIVLQTKNASAREAISLSLQQMELIRKEPVPEKELEGSRNIWSGVFRCDLTLRQSLPTF